MLENVKDELAQSERVTCKVCGEGLRAKGMGPHIAAHRRRGEYPEDAPPPIRHGTRAGYVAEQRAGIPTCPACRFAQNLYQRKRVAGD